ncbi:Gfo/Idh/MocA family protein [Paenibacillus thalictri]|uniref:Gfo/Idh/MocA family oxidoreductase n=1 Tax=Paenibacillus thalictri TaxID=2527873 RepID=A0A4Q9DLL6_9BACL|nr:Gfo/Idh/MocA family oxidoreductase [Paenibacillus thalictri]TBL75320.1 Gfo/Idh/MocA family oxidoreductase [Paenibacillus thalictri]
MSAPTVFGIIGGSGFRAQFYLRIAKALPERFQVGGMVVRDEQKGLEMERLWGVPTYRSLDELADKVKMDYVVLSVSKAASLDYLLELFERGIPVLTETPPASDLAGLHTLHERLTRKGARIQVAEQYQFQPMHAARRSIISADRLGPVSEATVSISQTYHAVSLMRTMLGVTFENASIRGMRFESPMLAGPDRSGPPKEEKRISAPRDIAWLDFEGKLGIYDFTNNQHRSWTRSNHLSVRGERGELFDTRLSTLADFSTPLHLEMKRINKGEAENLEGYFLQGILAGESWVYRNPFAPARLYDDEIAIATCLQKMADYAAGGPSFYGLPEASQDHYVGMCIEQAILSGETVQTITQPWAAVNE